MVRTSHKAMTKLIFMVNNRAPAGCSPLIPNLGAVGSNPAGDTNFSPMLMVFGGFARGASAWWRGVAGLGF